MMAPRGGTRIERGHALRRRVLDVLHDMGHGNTDVGRDRFIDHALWVARRLNMRSWSAASPEHQKQSARHSLRTLLGENKYGAWDSAAGTNVGWVLNIWEAACDDWFQVAQAPVEGTDAGTVAETAGMADQRPISNRILDAYLNRDSDRMLELLSELERLAL